MKFKVGDCVKIKMGRSIQFGTVVGLDIREAIEPSYLVSFQSGKLFFSGSQFYEGELEIL